MRLHKTTEVIDALIGDISPVGETNEDSKRYQNLEDLIEVMHVYLERIQEVAKGRNAPQMSIKALGEKAQIFKESLEQYIE